MGSTCTKAKRAMITLRCTAEMHEALIRVGIDFGHSLNSVVTLACEDLLKRVEAKRSRELWNARQRIGSGVTVPQTNGS